jgi:hypothetical protein
MQRISEASDSGWRAFFFPMINDDQFNQIKLFIHQDEYSSKTSGREKKKSTRFILNLKLAQLGELQIDGRVTSIIVDLLIQTRKPLPLDIKTGIQQIFQTTLKRTEINGNLAFRVSKELSCLPITELNGYEDSPPSNTII